MNGASQHQPNSSNAAKNKRIIQALQNFSYRQLLAPFVSPNQRLLRCGRFKIRAGAVATAREAAAWRT